MGFPRFFRQEGAIDQRAAEMMPSLHSFVDIAVRNGRRVRLLRNAGLKTFATNVLPDVSGPQVSFNYSNAGGSTCFSTAR